MIVMVILKIVLEFVAVIVLKIIVKYVIIIQMMIVKLIVMDYSQEMMTMELL